MALALWLGIPLFYVLVAMFVYRAKYRTAYSEFLRWKNEAPDEKKYRTGSDGWDSIEKRRREYSYSQFRYYVAIEESPFVCAIFWPFFWVGYVNEWLHPEVAIPDVAKIKELENL